MRYPLRYSAYEWIKAEKSTTDDSLLEAMNKNGSKCSPDDLNKVLMQLEILGLVSVRWVAKEKRRIELVEAQAGDTRFPRINE
jgi:hypothetical protein